VTSTASKTSTLRAELGKGVVCGEGQPLVVIAGPCVVESKDLAHEVAARMKDICVKLGVQYVFKASYDKANRTSLSGYRGPGRDGGLAVLSEIGRQLNLPVLTDIHESGDAAVAAQHVDVLQIPAFLCRQTDLLLAAAATGKAINVKKGQFLAPWDMKNVVEKLRTGGAANVLLTERGTSFGYNTLVVDYRGLPQLRASGAPVIFDVTHPCNSREAKARRLAGNVNTRALLLVRQLRSASTDSSSRRTPTPTRHRVTART